MSDRGIQAVREHLAKLPPSNTLTIEQRRKQYERAERVFPTPADVTIDRVTTPTRPAERLRPPGVRTDAAVLYLHGGGYVIGSPSSHRHLAAAIARAAGVQALLLDYRLAPEHPFPAALDDALAAYQWLQTQGVAPTAIIVAGDSAGGGLTMATLLALRDRNAAAAGGRRLHLAVGRPHVQRRQLCDAGQRRSDRHPRGHRDDGPGLRGQRRSQGPAGLAALRRPARSARRC